MIFFAPGEMGGMPTVPRPAFPPLTAPPLPGETLPKVPRPELPAPEKPPLPPPGPSWCLGAELAVCGAGDSGPIFGSLGGPDAGRVCRAMMNALCLVVGLFVILALLGVSLNALLRNG